MGKLQDWIYKFDKAQEGPSLRYARLPSLGLILLTLWVGYDRRCYRGMASPEAMDAAQVARNISEGKGFTTQFIRPVSIHFVKQRNEVRFGPAPSGSDADYARLRGNHPDLANPPLYPLVLAGLMKVLPFRYEINLVDPFWSAPPLPPRGPDERPKEPPPRRFMRYQPDFLISLFNQLLFFCTLGLFFLLARRLFDIGVARLSTLLLLGCELMWRFSVSGLSTMLLMLIFMGVTWCVVLLEAEANEPKRSPSFQFGLAGAIGLLVGLGTLTRYSFGWVIVPILVCLGFFTTKNRPALCLAAGAVFTVVILPWMYRNYQLCGLPLGTATLAPLEATFLFPGNRLERSLDVNWARGWTGITVLMPFIHKLLIGLRHILQNDLTQLGGGWAGSFFLVGLMLSFLNRSLRRLRYFLTGTLGVFMVVQALGRTQISEDVPGVNSENLLVLTFPLVLLFGVSMFYTLLEQINFITKLFRQLAVGVFAVIMCLPLVAALLPPRTHPVAYPPYFPPIIRQTAAFMKEHELMMSDMPWAVAWYGNRQCIWLTLNAQDDFFAINDFLKPIRGLYLTSLTMDSRFLSEWVRAGEHSWGSFVIDSTVRGEIPRLFPLRHAPTGYLPEQLFLADRERWKKTPETGSLAPDDEK